MPHIKWLHAHACFHEVCSCVRACVRVLLVASLMVAEKAPPGNQQPRSRMHDFSKKSKKTCAFKTSLCMTRNMHVRTGCSIRVATPKAREVRRVHSLTSCS